LAPLTTGRPIINGIKEIWFRDDRNAVFARREAPGGGWETYELPLPAVLGVKEGLNLPRYPSVPGRLRAKKKEVEKVALGASPSGALGLGAGEDAAQGTTAIPGPTMLKLRLPAEEKTQAEVLGEGAAAAPAVVDLLEKLGILAR
jgi:electron transfer flavoprotein beta subunit